MRFYSETFIQSICWKHMSKLVELCKKDDKK